MFCWRCGYQEEVDQKYDEAGRTCGWKHEISSNAGVLFYRIPDEGIVRACCQPLPTKKALLDAEQWLREAIDKGEVDRDGCYLTRWNREARQVEVIIGPLDDGSERTCGDDQVISPQTSSESMQPNTRDGAKINKNYSNDFPFRGEVDI
jgi:hypothetical protein